jgi:hypothetical protein
VLAHSPTPPTLGTGWERQCDGAPTRACPDAGRDSRSMDDVRRWEAQAYRNVG